MASQLVHQHRSTSPPKVGTRRRARASASLAVAFAVFTITSAALAAAPVSEADALFEAGRVAAERGDFATACPKFAESQKLDPGVGTLMNLADCEERSGRLAEAWQHWQQAQTELGPKDDRLAFATRRAAVLEPHVPRLTLRLAAGTPNGTRVKCDSADLGSPDLSQGISFSSAALPLNPGDHVVVVDAPGRAPQEFHVTLRARERRVLDVAPGAALASRVSGADPVSAPAASSPLGFLGNVNKTGLIVGSAGVVALTVALVAGAETIRLKNVVAAHCNAQRTCDGEGIDAGSTGKTMSAVSTVAFVAGLAGVGAGVYFVLADGKSGGPPKASLGMLSATSFGLRGAF